MPGQLPWCRLWASMPTDPKWRIVSKRCGRPVHEIVAVFTYMLTSASSAEERGYLEGWDHEDVAVALDMEPGHVASIYDAMQGKALDGDYLSGWEKRQPKREDPNATDRKRRQREQGKKGGSHTESRPVTQGPARGEETEEREENPPCSPPEGDDASGPDQARQVFDYWHHRLGKNGKTKFTDDRRRKVKARLSEGYTVDDLKKAVDGITKSPHHMGENDQGVRYDDLELICRKGSKTEHFMQLADQTRPARESGGSMAAGKPSLADRWGGHDA